MELAYRELGPADASLTLLCLHAVGHDQADYATLAALGAGHRVLSLDWPGHGGSGTDSLPASPERYARLCEAFVLALEGSVGQRKYVVLGNSIGGAVALLLATRSRLAPRLAGLVLIDAGGLMPMGVAARGFCRALAWAYRSASRGGLAARLLPWWYRRMYRRLLVTAEASERREAIVAVGLQRAAVLSQAWQSFVSPQASVIERCAEVRVPTLVCWARSDPFNSLRASLPAIERLPQGRLEVFEGGHAPHVEQPERFREVLLDYLSAL